MKAQRVCRPSPAGAESLGRLLRDYGVSCVGRRVIRLLRPERYPGENDRWDGWQRGLCGFFQRGLCAWFGAYGIGTPYEIQDSMGLPVHQVVRVGPYYFDSEGATHGEALLTRWGPDGELGRLFSVTAVPRLRRSLSCAYRRAELMDARAHLRDTRWTWAARGSTLAQWAIYRRLDRQFGDPRQILCPRAAGKGRSRAPAGARKTV